MMVTNNGLFVVCVKITLLTVKGVFVSCR